MIPCKKYNQDHLVKYYLITEWNDIQNIINTSLYGTLFRGQANATWSLTSSIERSTKGDFTDSEQLVILRAMRGMSNYLTFPVPDANDYYAWLSLLQHYGSPTRLLDVSYSAYVALFFAIIDLHKDEDACLWRIEARTINHYFYRDLLDVPPDTQGISKGILPEFTPNFRENETVGVALANKYIYHSQYISQIQVPKKYHLSRNKMIQRYNSGGFLILPPQYQTQRSLAQQAAFLFPINSRMPFEKNMLGMIDLSNKYDSIDEIPEEKEKDRVSGKYSFSVDKYIIPYQLKNIFLTELRKSNITYQTLFPDMHGFAKTLLNM